jgi:hypothetical protein
LVDNVDKNATGVVPVASDDINGVQYQIIKPAFGALDSATLVSATNPLPVDTELPAAAALSDTTANPTAPMVGGATMLWDGTQWVRGLSAAGGNNTPGGGVTATALLVWDGSNYQRSASGDANADSLGPYFLQLRTSAELRFWDGNGYVRQRGQNIIKTVAAVSVTAGTPVTIWTPTTGKMFRLMGYVLGSSVAGGIILLDGATEILRVLGAANTSSIAPDLGNGRLSTAINNPLRVNVTATGVISGYVYGIEE